MKKLSFLLTLVVVMTSCMFKSVMEGEADDISTAIIYNYEEKSLLVMLESVFQATSKEGGRGITTITGFNEQRISVYNLIDGGLIVRKKTGRQNKQAIEFLGCTKGNLWFYSFSDGIHSLEPETLEIKVSQDSIFEKNPEIKDKLASCEWYEYARFFQFNDINRTIILTDNQGYRYILDTESLRTQKVTWEYKLFEPRMDRQFETSLYFPSPSLNLSGDLRKQIRVDGKEIDPELTFLDGKFIIDRNPARILEGMDRRLSLNMQDLEEIYPEIMKFNSLNGGSGPLWGTKQRDTLRLLENAKNKLESDLKNLEECKKDISEDGYSHKYSQLLSSDTTTFLVFHASNTSKDANVVISRIHKSSDEGLKELWRTEVPGLFYDPSAAKESKIYKEVFSKGSPEFRYSLFDIDKKRMIIVWMLHVHCIDIVSGEILWKFRV